MEKKIYITEEERAKCKKVACFVRGNRICGSCHVYISQNEE